MKKMVLAFFAAACMMTTSASAHVISPRYKTTPREVATIQSNYLNQRLSLDQKQSRLAYKQCLRLARLQHKTEKASRAAACRMKRVFDTQKFTQWQRLMSNMPEPNAFGYPHPDRIVFPHDHQRPSDRPARGGHLKQ